MKLLPIALCAFAVSSYAATYGLESTTQATQLEEEGILFPGEPAGEQLETKPELPTEAPVAANEEAFFGEPVQEQVTYEDVETKPEIVEDEVLETKPEIVEETFETKPEIVEDEVLETKPEIVVQEEEVFETKPEIVEDEVLETKPEIVEEELQEVKPEIVEDEVLETKPEIVVQEEEVFETKPEIGLPGGKSDVDLSTIADDKDIQAVLDLGVETLLRTTAEEGNLPASENPFRITKINRIQQQVVSGTNYYCDVVLGNDADLQILATFTVFSQPWTNTFKVTDGCVQIGRLVKY